MTLKGTVERENNEGSIALGCYYPWWVKEKPWFSMTDHNETQATYIRKEDLELLAALWNKPYFDPVLQKSFVN